jgi:hypothetical protein
MLKAAKYAIPAGVALLAFGTSAGVVGAAGSARQAAATSQAPRPLFAVLHSPQSRTINTAGAPTWNFSYSYLATTYTDTFVGTNPTGGTSTTVPTYIIPIKMSLSGFAPSPSKKLSNGKTVIANTTASPIFQNLDYKQGGTDVGTTQYIDAFQRAALWGTVSSHTTYHVLLGTPTVKPLQTFAVPSGDGVVAKAFGVKVIVANINWFDAKAQSLITTLGIPSGALPIFLTTQTFLSNDGTINTCCIGGYHSVSGSGLPYSMFTYIQKSGAFSQDVSALSHEIGEYVDDPNTNNSDTPAACSALGNRNSLYEVGDPIEVDTSPKYGDYAYALGGFTYHLQDLVTPVYFGAPTSTSVNGWESFQGQSFTTVCANGG